MSENAPTPDPVVSESTEVKSSPAGSPSGGSKVLPILFILFILCVVASVTIYLTMDKEEGIIPIAFTPIALALWCLGQMLHAIRSKKSLDSITFYSHSEFFYYWPLWLVSFIFGDITLFFGSHVAVEGLDTSLLVMKQTGYGLTYILVMGFSLFATGVNLRGVWALLTLICIAFAAFILLYFGVWDSALSWAVNQPVYLNHGFYLAIGVILFIPWCVVVFLFDTRKYVKIESNTVTIVYEIGEGARAFDTIGVMMEKKLDNFFKHYLLGFGSGDLIIRTSGGSSEVLYLPNVLRVDRVLRELDHVRSQRGRL
ncbi:MAG: hypothetical protein QMC23_11360 [Rubritalea sp.]|jgi:hypothetical protein|tara:strand:+ start:3785 stop:4720 length:936 start_codon:yes stop_codon:yes gene_type:complete